MALYNTVREVGNMYKFKLELSTAMNYRKN
jgi:hypothetical protein